MGLKVVLSIAAVICDLSRREIDIVFFADTTASTFSAADVGTGTRTVPDGQRTLSNVKHIAWLMMMTTKEDYEGRSIGAGISL